MLEVVKSYFNGIVVTDALLEVDEFDGDNAGEQPFYRWPNSRFKAPFVQLLDGQPITLLADIRNSPAGRGATKFVRVGLNFKLNDDKRSLKLQELLKDYILSLKHSDTLHY